MPIVPEPDPAKVAVARDRQRDLGQVIDQQIANVARQSKRDRRGSVQPHEPERREGFDRRARVAKAAPDVKGTK